MVKSLSKNVYLIFANIIMEKNNILTGKYTAKYCFICINYNFHEK